MKKRIISLLMAVVMLVSVMPAMGASAAKGQRFSDAYRGQWFAKYVYPVSEAGIINGDERGRFNPGNKLKRCDVITMLSLSVKSADELKAEYGDMELCPDSPKNQWYTKSVNWAAQEGVITPGENFRPTDDITRMETVELVYSMHKAYPDKVPLTPVKEARDFPDTSNITAEQKEALDACTMGGVIDGNDKGYFMPDNTLTRDQAARIICDMLKFTPWSDSQIPEKPKPAFEAPKVGSAYGARYIDFDPQFFDVKVALSGGKLDTAASASSILRNQGAYIAVNGATFDANTTQRVNGTIVSGGRVIRDLTTPANQTSKPAFVIDTNGKASIQWMDITQTVSLTKDDKTYTINNIGQNTPVNDRTMMIYTKEYGTRISGTVRWALAVDDNNKVTKVYKTATDNVPIPTSGYILFGRKDRGWSNDDLFKYAEVGDTVTREIDYSGSTVQNVKTALSCGPTILKNGAVYGNSTTYAQEGYDSSSNVVSSGAHMLIGVKANGRVVIAFASGSQRQMGQIMKDLGCKDAMNLDGGASTYLNCNGSQMASPYRNLTNMLVFSKKQ